MKRMALVLVWMLGACTFVDSTEHCVETRYGNVVREKMDDGLNLTVLTDGTCFTLTDQNWPEEGESETVSAVTKAPNPTSIDSDIALVFAFDPNTVFDVFRAKRSQESALIEIRNAIRDGYRDALSTWTVNDVFSERRAALGDSVQAYIQRSVGSRALIKSVFIRELRLPPDIEQARTAAAKQAQVRDSVSQQFAIDSLRNRTREMNARTAALETQLRAEAYQQNQAMVQIDVAERMSRICANAQQCILGVSVMDRITGEVR